MMYENELAFYFKTEQTEAIIRRLSDSYKSPEKIEITDYFINKSTKLRCSISNKLDLNYYLITKQGSKKEGTREEKEVHVPESVFTELSKETTFYIKKNRTSFSIDHETKVVVDEINHPMKITVVELEVLSKTPKTLTIVDMYNISKNNSFKVVCPHNSFDYFNRKIGFCGGPSSGKSTTAQHISFLLNTQFGANSFHVTEYATTFLQKQKREPSFEEEFVIWYGQKNREADAAVKANMTISDCPSFLAYTYALLLPKTPLDKKNAFYLSKLYKRALEDVAGYSDLFFMKLIEYKENGIRYGSYEVSLDIENRIRNFLVDHNISYSEVTYNDIDIILNKILYLNVFE